MNEDGDITGSMGTYATLADAMASVPDERWSERVHEVWRPDVVRVGSWYEWESLPP